MRARPSCEVCVSDVAGDAVNDTGDAINDTGDAISDMASEVFTRTTRDQAEVRAALERWLNTRVSDAAVGELSTPGNGMSSDTVMFDATWRDDEGSHSAELVARLAAPDDVVPTFPDYDLLAQAKVMRLVQAGTTAPVPLIRWVEPDPTFLGCEFFVMDREHGDVPQDVMPYPIMSPLLDATAADQRRLQDASVDTLAQIHTTPLDPDPHAAQSTAFLEYDEPGDTALRRHFNRWVGYERWACEGHSLPLVHQAREWLLANWPTAADAREPVVSWGDARIGNMMYRDFEPVAVLDWEMAGIAPREIDVAWMVFLHTFFQDITTDLGLPGMPDFMTAEAVTARYRDASGIEPLELDWFLTYAAYRHAAIMVRVLDRRIHFGEAEPDAGGEAAILHSARLAEMIS